jgi:HAD superfamily hydrolase (TIGR01490 family)
MENPRLVIFDIDGTLIPGTSCERMFFRYLIEKKIIGIGNLINFAWRGMALAPKGRSYIIKANKGYLRGFTPAYMEEVGRRFFQGDIVDRISKKGLIALTEHKMKGHRVALLSGMPEFLLKNFSALFKVPEYHGSVMEIKSDKFTGRTMSAFPLGRGKVEIVKAILKKYGLEWGNVTAYADHYLDRFLLQKAGQPIAVNPDEKLRVVAERNHWRIEYFEDTKK